METIIFHPEKDTNAIAEAAAQSGTPDDSAAIAMVDEKGAITRLLWSGLKVALKAVNDALYAAREHSHTKSEITDFPASMTPAAHKASHKTGGSDAIAPADIGAAAASHSHSAGDISKGTLPIARGGTGASSASAARSALGAQATVVKKTGSLTVVIVAPAPDSLEAYAAAGVRCTAQASGKLTFTCQSVPTAALTVNVVIL